MKLLRVTAQGLPLFDDALEVDFFAEGRVSQEDNHEMVHLFKNVYLNKTITFTGLNASGKTQILNVLSFVMYLLQAKSINVLPKINFGGDNNVLTLPLGGEATIISYLFSEETNEILKLVTTIERTADKTLDSKLKYVIVDEKLFTKSVGSVKTKKDLFNFEEKARLKAERCDDIFLSLSCDVSLLNTFYKRKEYKNVFYNEVLSYTDFNMLSGIVDLPEELVQFLDPSIEYLHFEKSGTSFRPLLKFVHDDQAIRLDSLSDLQNILSSGTIKGCGIFMNALLALEQGGYVIIDELENHFNREIIATLLKFFLDRHVNVKGATLIYSTHYTELLDNLDRNDSIYIVSKHKGIKIEKLSKILKRKDMRRSVYFINGLLDDTAPSYQIVNSLQEVFKERITTVAR